MLNKNRIIYGLASKNNLKNSFKKFLTFIWKQDIIKT